MSIRRPWFVALSICAVTMVVLASPATAAGLGLGVSLHTEKGYIAHADPHVHWAKPVKTGPLTDYDGTGDQGRAYYDLTVAGGALFEVEGAIEASTTGQYITLGGIVAALVLPFTGEGDAFGNWFESELQLVQAGTQPKVTKAFGKVRVGLGFTAYGSGEVLTVTVAPASV